MNLRLKNNDVIALEEAYKLIREKEACACNCKECKGKDCKNCTCKSCNCKGCEGHKRVTENVDVSKEKPENRDMGKCPKCMGTKRMGIEDSQRDYVHVLVGYDKSTDTLPCDNCGGQQMYGKPTGMVRLRKDGTPCMHEYDVSRSGRNFKTYKCKHCNYGFQIDSGD